MFQRKSRRAAEYGQGEWREVRVQRVKGSAMRGVSGQFFQGFVEGGAGDAAFGDDGGDVSGGRHVEGRMRGVNVFR